MSAAGTAEVDELLEQHRTSQANGVDVEAAAKRLREVLAVFERMEQKERGAAMAYLQCQYRPEARRNYPGGIVASGPFDDCSGYPSSY